MTDEPIDWRKILNEQKNKDSLEQVRNKSLIIEAFREMWKTNPTEQEFGEYCNGLVLFAECLFIMRR